MMRWRPWIVLVGLAGAVLGGFLGCNAVLGLSDYRIGDAGLADALGDGPASCDVDPTMQCYPCTPTNDPQFLNACTTTTCVPFDDPTRITGLLPDGGLPPVPDLPIDAATDGGNG